MTDKISIHVLFSPVHYVLYCFYTRFFFHACLETASLMSCMYLLNFLFHLYAIQLFHFINIVIRKR